ncbi:MAG TPA: hypothetical protein VFZ10_03345, partial [Geminicoccaceae bacterium]
RAERCGHAQEVAALVWSGELSSHGLASPIVAGFAPIPLQQEWPREKHEPAVLRVYALRNRGVVLASRSVV